MRDRSSDVDRLAELLVGFGANLQPGQIVGVTAYLGMEDVARAVVQEAYKRGAKYVDVVWWDQLVKRAAPRARGRGDARVRPAVARAPDAVAVRRARARASG